MNCRSKSMWLMVLLALACGQLSAQVLGADALKKAVPSSFFFAGQSAPVQMRNSVGLKNAAGKLVLAGLEGTSITGSELKYPWWAKSRPTLLMIGGSRVQATIRIAFLASKPRPRSPSRVRLSKLLMSPLL